MSIVRAPRPPSSYYVLDNRIINDERLSWAARGLLVFLLSKPDHWKVSVEHLRRQTDKASKSTGRDGVYALLAELEGAGYIARQQARNADGTLAPTEYHVSESPLPALPDTVEPYTANPTLANTKKADSTKKAAKERGADAPMNFGIDIPSHIDAEAWADWHRFRNSRAGWTSRARALSLSKLSELAAQGYDQRKVVDQSIERGWTGLFPVQQDQRRQPNNTQPSRQMQAIMSVMGYTNEQAADASRVVLDVNSRRPEPDLLALIARDAGG